MTEDQKIVAAVADLKRLGVSAWSAAPPLFALLWKFSLPIPPPHFLGFRGHVLAIGGGLSVLVAVYLRFRPIFPVGDPDFPTGDPWWVTASAGLAFGLFCGLANYFYFRWRARQLGLPSWHDYTPDGGSPAA